MKLATTLTFFVALLTWCCERSSAFQTPSETGGNMISWHEYIPKGGIDIINTHLYVDLHSKKNELMLDAGSRWADKDRDKAEVVVFFQNRVWPTDNLPAGFDLSKAIVVSFEGSIVRFSNFEEATGGYYKREKE